MTNVTTCPACAGPDNAECATCGGTSEVTQEMHDAFMLEKERIEATFKLQQAISTLPVENIPGEQQSIVVITMADNSISAVVDSQEISWNEDTQSWS